MSVYQISKADDKMNVWRLPAKLMSTLKLQEDKTVTLNYGSNSATTIVKSARPSQKENFMGLSPEVKTTLGISYNTTFHVRPEGNGSFRLGPVIGILTFSSHIPNRLDYYKSYFFMNTKGRLVFIFCHKGINQKQRTITGYSYDVNKKTWIRGEFPFPDSVIDRCYPNYHSSHAILTNVIGQNRIFNKKTMITKVDFARVLGANNYLRAYIPETKVFRTISDLDGFFAKYDHVYLKPSNAMKGKGIISIQKTHEGKIECMYTSDNKDVVKVVDSLSQISDVLKPVTGRRRRYIVQQAINCMQYKGGPFSLRVSPVKNGKGQWVVIGILALGSLRARHITNFSSGGAAIPLSKLYDVIKSQISLSKDDFLRLLEGLAIKTATALDEKLGPLGELGVDFIMDKKGKPWLLEANGNPAKIAAFLQSDYPSWRTLVFQYPLDYASNLAGF